MVRCPSRRAAGPQGCFAKLEAVRRLLGVGAEVNRDDRVPVICVDRLGLSAFNTFNPNAWDGDSRGVVQSCASEFAVLRYSATRIRSICGSADALCRPYVDAMQEQWRTIPWDLKRTAYFGQVPELHVLTEGFFAGLKSLLDLLVQLLSTEGVVGVSLHGFHRANDVYGGVVVNALGSNVSEGKERVAAAIKALLLKHKSQWIDYAIGSRDLLVHPSRWAQQLMFEIQLESRDGDLVYVGARPPHVGETSIDRYTMEQIENARELSTILMRELRKAA